jgi:ParB-like chromosome segregation protein Spo0J
LVLTFSLKANIYLKIIKKKNFELMKNNSLYNGMSSKEFDYKMLSIRNLKSEWKMILVSSVYIQNDRRARKTPRKKLKSLQTSWSQDGQIQNIVVAYKSHPIDKEKEYKLIAGKGRLDSAVLNGDNFIMAKIFYDISEFQEIRLQRIENKIRENIPRSDLAINYYEEKLIYEEMYPETRKGSYERHKHSNNYETKSIKTENDFMLENLNVSKKLKSYVNRVADEENKSNTYVKNMIRIGRAFKEGLLDEQAQESYNNKEITKTELLEVIRYKERKNKQKVKPDELQNGTAELSKFQENQIKVHNEKYGEKKDTGLDRINIKKQDWQGRESTKTLSSMKKSSSTNIKEINNIKPSSKNTTKSIEDITNPQTNIQEKPQEKNFSSNIEKLIKMSKIREELFPEECAEVENESNLCRKCSVFNSNSDNCPYNAINFTCQFCGAQKILIVKGGQAVILDHDESICEASPEIFSSIK